MPTDTATPDPSSTALPTATWVVQHVQSVILASDGQNVGDSLMTALRIAVCVGCFVLGAWLGRYLARPVFL